MMQVGAALEALIAGLRGHTVSTTDWRPVIALANRTLLTPALFSALAHSGEIHRLSEVVSRIFRTFIMRRLRFQIAAVDRVAAYSCSIWPTTLFRRCAVVALPPG